jgi:uncharacterized protein Yka (UPF0111/DUF47 family)
MTRRRWFLPRAPDLLGLLKTQAAITIEGLDAFAAWANGDALAAERVRASEHEADDRKGELRDALTEAFTTPLEPEDLFELSRGLDDVLNSAKNTVREAEVMGTPPDAPMAEMAAQLAAGARDLAGAFDALARRAQRSAATDAADAAIKHQRHLEHIYRAAMSSLLDGSDLVEVTSRRELYRRLVRASDHLARVAERVWYAVLKVS